MDTASTTSDLVQRGERLEYFTIFWNSIEGLISIAAGIAAGSIALIGFGLESVIEVASGSALLWRMRVDRNAKQRARAERITLEIVQFCFLALAAYVTFASVHSIVQRHASGRSTLGIAIAVVSLVVMSLLARAKGKVGTAVHSAAMVADSQQTRFCAYLSVILLAGLFLNLFLGWWWADSVAALVMVPIIANEGIQAISRKVRTETRTLTKEELECMDMTELAELCQMVAESPTTTSQAADLSRQFKQEWTLLKHSMMPSVPALKDEQAINAQMKLKRKMVSFLAAVLPYSY